MEFVLPGANKNQSKLELREGIEKRVFGDSITGFLEKLKLFMVVGQ